VRPGRALALAALVALAAPAAASAHAQLEGTSPVRGAVVARQPAQVVFRFDEAVEGTFGAVRAFDDRGRRVDRGDAFHPHGAGPQIGVHLRPGLPDGTYTATYRVVSADGHIVAGGSTFSIGHPSAAGRSVASLLGDQRSGAATEVVFAAARALQYGAIGLAVGICAFLLACWRPALRSVAADAEPWRAAQGALLARARRCALLVAGVGVLSAAAGIVLEGAEAAGVSGWSALRLHTLSEVLGTRFGTVWAIALGAWLLVGVLGVALAVPTGAGRTGRRAATAAMAAPLAYLLVAPALGGHGATQSPVAVLFASLVIHVAAMSVWLGGLVALLACVPATTRRLDGADRTRLLAAVLVRFSTVALGAVIAILLTGLVQSYVEIRHLSLLFTTPFGRAAFIKLALLLGLIGLGALHRRRVVPRLAAAARVAAAGGPAATGPGATGVLLRRVLRAEVALIAVVLGTTGALASYAPAVARGQGPVEETARIGPAEVQLAVDPARVGANELHLYLIDPVGGAPFTRAREITVTATLPAKGIGPLPLRVEQAGPGHVVIPDAFLTAAGDWDVRITVRVSEFDEFARVLEVSIG
jgi:copper transport protein